MKVLKWIGSAEGARPIAEGGYAFPAPVGPRVGAGGTAATPILQRVYLGLLGVSEGLRKAQDAANEAREG